MKQGIGRMSLFKMLAMAAVAGASFRDRYASHSTAVSSKYKSRDAFMFDTQRAHRRRMRGLRSSGRHNA